MNGSLRLGTCFAAMLLGSCSSGENGNVPMPDGGAGKEAGSSGAATGGRSAAGGASSGGQSGSSGTSTGGSGTGGALTCGTTQCSAPIGSNSQQVTTCCTDANTCGLTSPLVDGCLAPSQPGMVSSACAPLTPPVGQELDGCCGPNGCGALSPFMGCLANPDLGRAPVACNYDPTNDCTTLAAVPCDGAEDCPSGKHCCARFGGATFTDFGCFDSCLALNPDGGGPVVWRQLCHAGDACEDPTFTCRTSDFLPESLTRCFTDGTAATSTGSSAAGEVSCGTSVCGSGEKCCMREPGGPYCAPTAVECKCHPVSTDGGFDGSSPNLDASTDGRARD